MAEVAAANNPPDPPGGFGGGGDGPPDQPIYWNSESSDEEEDSDADEDTPLLYDDEDLAKEGFHDLAVDTTDDGDRTDPYARQYANLVAETPQEAPSQKVQETLTAIHKQRFINPQLSMQYQSTMHRQIARLLRQIVSARQRNELQCEMENLEWAMDGTNRALLLHEQWALDNAQSLLHSLHQEGNEFHPIFWARNGNSYKLI